VKARSALGVASAGKKKMWNRPSPLNRESGSWASNRWAAAVRFVGHHVAQRYTRGKQKPQGGRTDPERQRGSDEAP